MTDETPCCGDASEGISDEEFEKFCELKGQEGAIPAGRIEYVTGQVFFRSGAGQLLTKEQYVEKYGFDPDPVWRRIQAYQVKTQKFSPPDECPQIRSVKYKQLSRLPQFNL